MANNNLQEALDMVANLQESYKQVAANTILAEKRKNIDELVTEKVNESKTSLNTLETQINEMKEKIESGTLNESELSEMKDEMHKITKRMDEMGDHGHSGKEEVSESNHNSEDNEEEKPSEDSKEKKEDETEETNEGLGVSTSLSNRKKAPRDLNEGEENKDKEEDKAGEEEKKEDLTDKSTEEVNESFNKLDENGSVQVTENKDKSEGTTLSESEIKDMLENLDQIIKEEGEVEGGEATGEEGAAVSDDEINKFLDEIGVNSDDTSLGEGEETIEITKADLEGEIAPEGEPKGEEGVVAETEEMPDFDETLMAKIGEEFMKTESFNELMSEVNKELGEGELDVVKDDDKTVITHDEEGTEVGTQVEENEVDDEATSTVGQVMLGKDEYDMLKEKERGYDELNEGVDFLKGEFNKMKLYAANLSHIVSLVTESDLSKGEILTIVEKFDKVNNEEESNLIAESVRKEIAVRSNKKAIDSKTNIHENRKPTKADENGNVVTTKSIVNESKNPYWKRMQVLAGIN